jgi:hypothetical protein
MQCLVDDLELIGGGCMAVPVCWQRDISAFSLITVGYGLRLSLSAWKE